MKEIYLGAGCFWGSEFYFERLPGVEETVVGYGGGHVVNPSYEEVKEGETGHVELVKVTYDEDKISTGDLIEHFFNFHDPTQKNRQGEDVGSQYRSAVYYVEEDQGNMVRLKKNEWQDHEEEGKEIVTQVKQYKNFYKAEEYHQKYAQKNGGSCSIF